MIDEKNNFSVDNGLGEKNNRGGKLKKKFPPNLNFKFDKKYEEKTIPA